MDLTCTAWLVVALRPWWFLLASLAVVPSLAAWLGRRRGRSVPRLSVWTQSAAVVAATAALAGVSLPLGTKAFKPVLLLRDVSGSTRGQGAVALDWPEGLERKVYTFGAGVGPEGSEVAEDGTHGGAALRAAAAEARNASGTVIHTDGRFTDAWEVAARGLGRLGGDVMIVPMASPPADGRVVAVSARRGEGQAVDVTVSLAASAPRRRRITVRRVGADKPLLDEERLLVNPSTIRLADTLGPDEAAQYAVALSPGDTFPENDRASALVMPVSRRVAVFSREDVGGQVARMLDGMGVEVAAFLPNEAPATEAGWSRWAAVVLVDVTGTILSRDQRGALARYVRNGGGLVLIGAAPHRTPADEDDPLTRVAALRANPHQRRPMRVTVVLDASGSMSQLTETTNAARQVKYDVAVEAVMALKKHLTPADSLAVITFADAPRRVYDSGAGAVDYVALRKALVQVKPSGPTRVGKALAEAVGGASDAAKTELVLVVSDLVTEKFDVGATVKLFKDGGRDLAVVATASPGTDRHKVTDLTNLAWQLEAPIERREHFRGLAEIFATFLSEHRGSAIKREGGPFAVLPSGRPFGVDVEGIEDLSAYVLSAPRPRSQVVMRVGDDRDALMAYRRVGLGRSVGLAAVVTGSQGAAWRMSAKVAALVRAAATACMRQDPGTTGVDCSMQAVQAGERWTFRFETRDADGLAVNLKKLTLHVEALADRTGGRDVPLVQVAPGRYEAVAARPEGAYLLAVRAEDGNRWLWQHAYGRSASAEFRGVGADRANLRRLAELTGGTIVPARKIGATVNRWDSEQYTDMWPALAALALMLVLIDWVATRTWKRWA